MFADVSGQQTPLSSSGTLTTPPSPKLKGQASDQPSIYLNPRIQPSHALEYIASRPSTSSAVYIYDLAAQVGVGALSKEWRSTSVIDLQTRAGAGLALVGRLSESTSKDRHTGAMLTAYTTPAGLSAMAPALSYLPPASAASRLVLQVPNVAHVPETYSWSPSLASLSTSLALLPENIVVLLSATPQQIVDFASLSYQLTSHHVVHIFNHFGAGRETGHALAPLVSDAQPGSLRQALSRSNYNFFEYHGPQDAAEIVVVLNGPLALAVRAISGVGILIVNVLRPWDEEALSATLPLSVEKVHVLEDASAATPLHMDVLGSLMGKCSVRSHQYSVSQLQNFLNERVSLVDFLQVVIPGAPIAAPELSPSKKVLFFATSPSALDALPAVVAEVFYAEAMSVRLVSDLDVLSTSGAISRTSLLLAKAPTAKDTPLAWSKADLVIVLGSSLFKTHALLDTVKPGAIILAVTSSEELASTIPDITAARIRDLGLRLFAIDAKTLATELVDAAGPANDAVMNLLVYLAFLRLYLGVVASQKLVLQIAASSASKLERDLTVIGARAWTGLSEVLGAAPEVDTPPAAPLKRFDLNAIATEAKDGGLVVNGARVDSWHEAAKHLMFPAAYIPAAADVSSAGGEYARNPSLRPEVPERTFLVTCTVNRRLTPTDYDRNVFHLEFDTSGTGLKYSIGEALGVHGWNDTQEVLDFCEWYGVDPNGLVTIPVAAGDPRLHTRTVFQSLQQQIDLFGRPGKSFYTELAAYATEAVDRYALQFIGSSEGASTFKKLGEKDTVTFADVLRMYLSAHPSIENLCTLIGDIKPRHYSIASAQSVVGDRVDLLVVTVDWKTPTGALRYGQCTRYLAGLRVGQKVTVSIKPSVMKLPPDNRQPLIMAGLGTGAAPFRAFLQHRALLAAKGEVVGPVYYYFGSRHQSQEYLYGEEIEAFLGAGIITRAGLAFSRDGPRKVYIQHKMREDAFDLVHMLKEQSGVFYLCGPTWPVPDIYEALVSALTQYEGMTPESAGAYLEGLKEEERYVLEVY
ncbi:hypothetical protein FISHEDRAFT_56085 [Fistulina hepatica ATCC 64428]|uniref:assimilatory sulfite reductase (NADPH) n=1 Tax=Fistulina hepatica ATCC 64428 TaxID=1128425 RepID=A0A0D7ANJ9_9AGAR|nr:hypothetical protein FISHEDRAFT_56085 [Fistulina hepatica ATCC 64428]